MSRQVSALRYAVRFKVVSKYFGQLCLLLAALTLVPLSVALGFGNFDVAIRYVIVVGGLVVLGSLLVRQPEPARIQPNEGMVIVAAMFAFAPLVMAYPLMASGLSYSDAVFEAVSAVTTTGLSTKATLAGASHAFLFARAWMQWYGALGIVVLSLALVFQPGILARDLAVSETAPDDMIGGTRAHARRTLRIYLALTVLGVIGAIAAGTGLFDAFLYTFSAVSTGGFAPKDASLAALGLPAQAWITLLCVAGAVPLAFYERAARRQKRAIAVDLRQIAALLIFGVGASGLLVAIMMLTNHMGWRSALHQAPLLAFSAHSTAGFASMPIPQLHAGAKLVLILLMVIGGGVGSTAGGIKLVRLLMVGSALRFLIERTALARHAVSGPRLAGRPVDEEELSGAMLLIILFVVAVALSWVPFVAMGYDPLNSLFEVVSAAGTAGLSTGITSGALPGVLKAILCADMLLGRLEIVAWLILLYPWTWLGRRMVMR